MDRTRITLRSLAVFVSIGALLMAAVPGLTAAPQGDPDAELTRIYLPLMLSDGTQPEPPSCYEGLVNGDFESDAGWEIRDNPVLAAYAPEAAHGGLRSMRTGIRWGGENVTSYSPVQQVITFPEPSGSDLALHATLSFWHYNAYGDATTAAASALPDRASLPRTLAELQAADLGTDFFYAIGIYEDDTIDWLLVERVDVHVFRQTVVDISRYAGHQIRLQFGTYNNGEGGISRTFVDDVSLTICPGTLSPGQPYLRQTISFAPDVHPAGVAVKPDGKKVYMAQQAGAMSELAVFEALPTLALSAEIPLGTDETAPNGVALVDAAGRVAVALRDTARAWVVNAETGESVTWIPANWLPNGIAVHNGYGYIANFGNSTITVFDPVTLTGGGLLYVGSEPSHFAVTDGEDLFASMHGNDEIVRLRNGEVAGHFYGIEAPYGLAYEQTTNHLYVANRGPSHTVSVLDGTTGELLDTLAIGREPFVLAINPTTGHLFVACGDRVQVYTTSDHALLAEIAVPPGAEEGIAVDPVNSRVYVTSRSGSALSVVQDRADLVTGTAR